jgi:hypothetical protein
MALESENIGYTAEISAFNSNPVQGRRGSRREESVGGKAFRMLTQTSSSFESAFYRLQEKVQRPIEELEFK